MTTAAEKTAEGTAVPEKRKALGRGLESLLPSGPRPVMTNPAASSRQLRDAFAYTRPCCRKYLRRREAASGDTVSQIRSTRSSTILIRRAINFDTDALQELAESIRANGVVQPIVVRPGAEGRYVLILGERRCRASKLAGKTTIPAIVRKVSDQQAAEMTVVENLQRQDLNCMEQAAAFAKLSRDFGLTQEQIGQRVGVSRESVSNYMRLLKLPGTVMQYLQEGRLGFSEARVLLTLLDASHDPEDRRRSSAQAFVGRATGRSVFQHQRSAAKAAGRTAPGTLGGSQCAERRKRNWNERWACGCGSATAREKERS